MSNPYELRFTMLMEAKQMLIEEYHAKREELTDRYHALKDVGEPIDFPDLPKYPSFDDIQSLCNKMNSFVSNAGGKY